jgi:hypothetical protein
LWFITEIGWGIVHILRKKYRNHSGNGSGQQNGLWTLWENQFARWPAAYKAINLYNYQITTHCAKKFFDSVLQVVPV